MATYVVPLSRPKAAVASALNLVVFAGLLYAVVVAVTDPTSEMGPASVAIAAVGAAATAALFALNLRGLRRGYDLVRRPALSGAPAGSYPVRPRQERR